MSDPFTGQPWDDRPYPREQKCLWCDNRTTVVGPGDSDGQLCTSCLLFWAEEARRDAEDFSWCGTFTMTDEEKAAVVTGATG